MTDYGRGPGPEPWHPDDPLYGDEGWGAQQPADGSVPYAGQQPADGGAPYAGQQQHGYPQQNGPQQPQQQYGGGQDPYQQAAAQQQYGNGQQYDPQQQGQYAPQQDGYAPQQDGRQQYGNGQQYDPQGTGPQQQYPGQQTGAQQQYDPRQTGPQQQYGNGQQYDPQGSGPQQQYPGRQTGPQQQYTEPQQYADPQYNSGWDTGQQAAMPYGNPPAAQYGAQQGGGYGETPDQYGTPEAYPPPQPPGGRRTQPAPQAEPEPEPEPEKETHPFFTGADGVSDKGPGHDDEYDDDPDGTRGNGRDRGGKPKKRRSGAACLVIAVVLIGGTGGVGYVAYQFYQDRFGPAPDYEGSGSNTTVQVEIPTGAGGLEIAGILLKYDVIKSQGAFVEAQNKNPKGNSIQAGVYTLKKQMSGVSALDLMLNPNSHNALIVPPGARDVDVYASIDKKLELKAGTTAGVAKAQAKNLGLPDWANDNKDIIDPLEGFLYPASYPVAKTMKPVDVLRKMVNRANAEYGKQDLTAEAKKLGLESPLELVTVASLVQAEGKYKQDFDKVSRVVYNRLKPNNTETVGRLDFDSTVNYLKGTSKLSLGSVDKLRTIDSPYNTYSIRGLPPGPIGNPGEDALHSAINPVPGPWYYFVAVNDKTLFAVTNAEQNKNREKYLKEQKKQ